MFNTLSSSTITLKDKMLAEVSKDVSARPIWFIIPAGLDLSAWQLIEYSESGTALTENALKLPKDYLEVKPLYKAVSAFTPKTELASHLWEIRMRIIASGEQLLDWDGVQKEVSQRRGERE